MQRAKRPSEAKKRGMNESRRSNFIEFCQKRGLEDPTADHIPIEESNFILGCYTIIIIMGDNILGLNLQCSTERKYIAAVIIYKDAKLQNLFTIDSLDTNSPEVLLHALA